MWTPDPSQVVTIEQKAADLRVADIAAVKLEANRRIEAIMPDFKQRNALALGMETVMTYGADPAVWPPQLQQLNGAMLAKWAAIKAIRTKSDEIEAMDPIPADFRDDTYWPL